MSEGALEYNRNVLGKEYPRGTFRVTRELIMDFVQAVGEKNPLYTDERSTSQNPYEGLIAPPTLVSLFVHGEEPPDLDLKFDGIQYMAGQWVEPRGPIRPGDVLTCTARLKDVYQKTGRSGTMVFVVVENTFVNQHGEVAAVVGWSMVRRK